jgi:hypothetical protein
LVIYMYCTMMHALTSLKSVSSIFMSGVSLYRLWKWNRQSVPKRRQLKFRRRKSSERKNTSLD